MFRLWHFRFGAQRPDELGWLQLGRPHSHVSIQRARWCRLSSSATGCSSTTSTGQVAVEHIGSSADQARFNRAHIATIPHMTKFTSPFEQFESGSGVTDSVEGPDTLKQVSRLEFTQAAAHLEDAQRTASGLGPWVISTNDLQAHSKRWNYISSLDSKDGSPYRASTAQKDTTTAINAARKHSLLALTLEYNQRLHRDISNGSLDGPEEKSDPFEVIFTTRRLTRLRFQGYEVEDVACWGWVLSSNTADIAVTRLHALATLVLPGNDASRVRDAPYFMFNIILRSRHINAQSLALLLELLQSKPTAQNSPDSGLPDSVTAIILLVRLIRHARKVAPGQMIPIAGLAERLLKAGLATNPSTAVIRRTAHNYNRLLSLLSIPTSQHPFRAVPIQQQAQFKLIRQMSSTEPALPVTREGYQALAKVQLMHRKTSAEQDWARTKASSWPPWREDKLGISQDIEYSGSQSRAADILRRQVEAGYMQTAWDQSARIIAGWDMDNSPTIQVRHVLPKASPTWLNSLYRRLGQSTAEVEAKIENDSDVWASRISATRTIREAWACFCAYDSSWGDKSRVQGPYQSMFEKLASRRQQTKPGTDSLPGDGREVQPPPPSANDHLYVPVEPPSFHDLYKKLQTDGVKPAGSLLSLLLDHARTRREGVKYVQESKLSEIKKDVLLNAHKYDVQVIRSTLQTIQPIVLASYFSMIWRRARGRHRGSQAWYLPASHADSYSAQSSGPVGPQHITGVSYVLELMKIVDFAPQVYNKVIQTMLEVLRTKSDTVYTQETWERLLRVLGCMEKCGREADMSTFYSVASTVEYIIDGEIDVNFQLSVTAERDRIGRTRHGSRGQTLAKRLFAQALGFSSPHQSSSVINDMSPHTAFHRRWLPISPEARISEAPSPAALHLMMRLLVKAGEMGSVFALLQWMDRFAEQLTAVSNELANGHRQMRFTLCVAAMAIEDLHAVLPHEDSLVKARWLVDKNPTWGGWPKDDELERYLLAGTPQ